MALAAFAAVLLAGCATGPNANPRDPFEPFNREVMKFNEGVDAAVLKPVATAYRQAIPPLVRTGVSNFFGNLSDVWSFVNSALQFKLQNAAEDFMRVNVNTFFGLGGILDIASDLNIERHKEDFGQTLGRWGLPAGPYLVLPLLGPSTLRDAAALPVDLRADLVRQVTPLRDRDGLYLLRLINARANLLRVGDVVNDAALDKYSFTRDAHLQRRRAEIYDADPKPAKPGAEPAVDNDGQIPPDPTGTPAPAAGQPDPAPAR
ncbi:MAG: VacJ family lipoprotein [Ramlibacter sp.]